MADRNRGGYHRAGLRSYRRGPEPLTLLLALVLGFILMDFTVFFMAALGGHW